jgi:Phospholipase_D-nuclease N-terminal
LKLAVICVAVFAILLDLFASTRILRSVVHSRTQQIAWLLLVWLAPLVGAILALQMSADPTADAPPAKSCEPGSQVWIPGIGPDDGASGG